MRAIAKRGRYEFFQMGFDPVQPIWVTPSFSEQPTETMGMGLRLKYKYAFNILYNCIQNPPWVSTSAKIDSVCAEQPQTWKHTQPVVLVLSMCGMAPKMKTRPNWVGHVRRTMEHKNHCPCWVVFMLGYGMAPNTKALALQNSTRHSLKAGGFCTCRMACR